MRWVASSWVGVVCVAFATAASAQGIQIEFSPAERARLVNLAESPSRISTHDYRKMAEMVFGHRMAADAATARAWKKRNSKLTTHSGYWAQRKAAEDAAHLKPVWNRLKQALFESDPKAQQAMRNLMTQARNTGLSNVRRWGGNYQREIQRELDRLKPTPRVGNRPYTPLRIDEPHRRNGTNDRRAPVASDFPNAPHILTGVADWWARQPEDVRKLANQALSELKPAAQRKLLMELADDEIQTQLRTRPPLTAHRETDWHRGFPPPMRAALQKESPAMQQAIRNGLANLDREGWKRLGSALRGMDYDGASGQAMLNVLKNKSMPRSDSRGKKLRSEADLFDGRTSFDNYARFLEPQVRGLVKRETQRAAKEANDKRWEFVDSLQRTQADPGLAERGKRYAKMWEVINRTPAEELAAFGKGFGKQGVDTVAGIANMIAHPIDTATGLYHLSQNPEMILVALDDASVDGDEFAGRLTFELALAAATAGPKSAPLSAADKARKAAQMSKTAAQAGKLNRARRLAKLAQGYADDAVKQGLRDGSGARNVAEEAAKYLDGVKQGGGAPSAAAPPSGSYRGARGALLGEDPGSGASRASKVDEAGKVEDLSKADDLGKADDAPRRADDRPEAPDPSRLDDLARYEGPRGGPDDPVWTTPKGTAGDKVGDFSDITGMSLEDIMGRLPKDAIEEPWKAVKNGAEHGRKFKWVDPTDGVTRRLRLHGPDPNPNIPKGNNAAEGWVARVQKGKQQFLDPADGRFHTASQMSDDVANRSHIPIDMNPNGRPKTVVDPKRGPVSAKPADGLPPPPIRGAGGAGAAGMAGAAGKAPTPREYLAQMLQRKRDALKGVDPHDRDGAWRGKVGPETEMVRVIDKGEMAALMKDGKVLNRMAQDAVKNPTGHTKKVRDYDTGGMRDVEVPGKHQRIVDTIYDKGPDGKLTPKTDHGVTHGGARGPYMPVSAWAPADSGYVQALTKDPDRYLVKFKPEASKKMGAGNNSPIETEYLKPLGYSLDDVEWIANVADDQWVWGKPGAPGDPAKRVPVTPPTPRPVGVNPVPNLQARSTGVESLAKRVLDKARKGFFADTVSMDDYAKAAELHMDATRAARQARDKLRHGDYEEAAQLLTKQEAALRELRKRVEPQRGR